MGFLGMISFPPHVATNLSFIEPMKALLARELPTGNWLYEMKFDAYRANPRLLLG
jgi:ATP-dependent DNA ligase